MKRRKFEIDQSEKTSTRILHLVLPKVFPKQIELSFVDQLLAFLFVCIFPQALNAYPIFELADRVRMASDSIFMMHCLWICESLDDSVLPC